MLILLFALVNIESSAGKAIFFLQNNFASKKCPKKRTMQNEL